jgi:hypothetical protein
MLTDLRKEEATEPCPISTGHLRDPEWVRRLVMQAYDHYRGLDEGKMADYIPALARASCVAVARAAGSLLLQFGGADEPRGRCSIRRGGSRVADQRKPVVGQR